jgi:hypothetical protein
VPSDSLSWAASGMSSNCSSSPSTTSFSVEVCSVIVSWDSIWTDIGQFYMMVMVDLRMGSMLIDGMPFKIDGKSLSSSNANIK